MKTIIKIKNFKLIKAVLNPFVGKYYRSKYNFENSVKNHFKLFFEGYSYGFDDETIKPIIDLPLNKVGITKFLIKKKNNVLYLTIEGERIGLLIGKGGRCINELKEFYIKQFNVKDVVYKLSESRIWKNKSF